MVGVRRVPPAARPMCPARLTAIASTPPSTSTGRPRPAAIRSACCARPSRYSLFRYRAVVAVFTHLGTAVSASDSRRAVNPTTPSSSTSGTTSRCRRASITPAYRPGTATPASNSSRSVNPAPRGCCTRAADPRPAGAYPSCQRRPAGATAARSTSPRSVRVATASGGRSVSSRSRYQRAASASTMRSRPTFGGARFGAAGPVMPLMVGSRRAAVTRSPPQAARSPRWRRCRWWCPELELVDDLAGGGDRKLRPRGFGRLVGPGEPVGRERLE